MKKHFLVVEDSFIGMTYISKDAPVANRIVHIEVDVDKGGMTPGSNLVECDEQGNPLTDSKPATGGKAKAKPKAGEKPPAGETAEDLA